MFHVTDMRATVHWCQSIGFTVVHRYEDDGERVFAKPAFGACALGAVTGPRDVSVWLYTDSVEAIYRSLKARDVQFGGGSLRPILRRPARRIDFIRTHIVPTYW